MKPRTPASTHAQCPYCAHAPVPHWAQWVIGTVDALAAMVRAAIGRGSLRSVRNQYAKATHPVVQAVERMVMGTLAHTPLIRASSEITSSEAFPTGRLRVIWKEALRRGIPIELLTILGSTTEECRAKIQDKKWYYFQAIPVPPWLEPSGWVEDKWEMKRRFAAAGLPVAEGRTVLTESAALRAARELGWPVIVKPREGSRARHTFLNIQDDHSLLGAFRSARQLGAFVLVEKYIPGDTYRATCVNGKLIAVMHFIKPKIVADGVRSCSQLREAYNASIPHAGVSPVADGSWFSLTLSRQGFTPESVPYAGTTVVLAEHSERSNGGINEDVTDRIPSATRATIEHAATLSNCAVIGFDLVSEDLTRISDGSVPSFYFIEGNTLPFIDIHHEPSIGEPRNVAGAVWDLWK